MTDIDAASLALPDGTASQSSPAIIHLKTSMLVPKLHSENIMLTAALTTIRALIFDVGQRTKVSLINGDGELIDFLDVRLNGKRIAFFPAGLDTILNQGDEVLIRLVPIGGG